MSTRLYYNNSTERAYITNTVYAYCNGNKIDYSQSEDRINGVFTVDLLYTHDEQRFNDLLQMLANAGYTVEKCPAYKT
jgi:hypothetical protein